LRFDDLHYANWAIESYAVFRRLRDNGTVPAGIRFQVSLPTPLGGFQAFFSSEDGRYVHKAYEAAMLAEVDKMCAAIPHADLAIQWDVASETVALAQGRPVKIGGDAFERWSEETAVISAC